MAVNIEKLQQMFPLVDLETINEIVAKNPGSKIYTEAIPQLKLIQEYKESVNPQLSPQSKPSAPARYPSISQNEGAAATDAGDHDQPPAAYQDNNNNNMQEVLLQTKPESAPSAHQNRYNSINAPYTDASALDYSLYKDVVRCECCCGDPRKPRAPYWTCDCRECCKCCFLLPDDNNYNGSKLTKGFLYEKDVKLFMYAFLILIFMSIPAEIAYDIDVNDGRGENLFIGPVALIITLVAVVLYFMKCAEGRMKNMVIAALLALSAVLYLSSYVYHTVYLKDFTPSCDNWWDSNSCSSWGWYWENDYCYECLCTSASCDSCSDGSFGPTYDECYHFEKSYFVSRGLYISFIMGLLSLHFFGIRKVISSRMGFIKFMIIVLTFYSICVGGVTAGSYYYQVIGGCASFIVALLLFILYFLVNRMNEKLKYNGGCNGIISMGTLLYIFVIQNTLQQLITTAIVVANWGDDKGGWLWCWEFSITIFGLFNFIIFFRALHPCLMCNTCTC